MGIEVGAIGTWLGGITASQVAAGAAMVSAAATVASASRKPPKQDLGQTLMPTKDIERKVEDEVVTLGSERGNERRGRQTGRTSLMAPRTGAAAPNTPAAGVKI